MSVPHAQPGELIDVTPLGESLSESKTHTLLKTADMEVLRLVMPAGKAIAEHKAPGEITVQCLEGQVDFMSDSKTVNLTAGQMLYLSAAAPHSLSAKQDSTLLVTILLGNQK